MTHRKKAAFLLAYRSTGIITDAALAAGVDRKLHYYWLKNDTRYAIDFADAEGEAFDSLLREAHNQALHGIEEPIIWQGERMGVWRNQLGDFVPADDPTRELFTPSTVRKKHPVMVMFLINRADRALAAERQRGELSAYASQSYTQINFIFGKEATDPDNRSALESGLSEAGQRGDIDGRAVHFIGRESERE
ncbi:MAG: hypothetical protein EXR86_12390 [Gammaproteobacteria bacterium]|nr:hypothetical protein [Gammaproteobacteria bacterium]